MTEERVERLHEELRRIDCDGTMAGKLNTQRISILEKTLDEIKKGVDDVGDKVTRYQEKIEAKFDKMENWKTGIIVGMIILAVLAGINVGELLKSVITTIVR